MRTNQQTLIDNAKKLAAIYQDISKAYNAASSLFHSHFKGLFDNSLRTELMIKEKYIQSLYDNENLYSFVDECVRYRIGILSREPNKNKFIYSMNDPYMLTESLDDILHRIMYSAYPNMLINEFKHYLDSYIHDERIVNVILSKLETDQM